MNIWGQVHHPGVEITSAGDPLSMAESDSTSCLLASGVAHPRLGLQPIMSGHSEANIPQVTILIVVPPIDVVASLPVDPTRSGSLYDDSDRRVDRAKALSKSNRDFSRRFYAFDFKF